MIGDTTLTTHRVRYSAAYPTGRERMLEPQYGCAGESSAFGGKPHEVRPVGPQGAARERIEDFSPNLFWDADPADLDFSKHMKYVVQRVLERGTLDDMRHMFSMYGFDNVVATSKSLRSLDPVSFSFIVNLSGQPKESFRCYTLKQSSQAPWIY